MGRLTGPVNGCSASDVTRAIGRQTSGGKDPGMSTGNAIAVRQEATITELPQRDHGALMEQVIVKGDLSKLQPEERAKYYMAVCQSVGLNPLTRPFLYVQFSDGGLQLYPRKEAADQLRGIHKVQTRIVEQRVESSIYLVVVEARHPDGRVETDIGAVPIDGQKGLFLANAMKKAITQGKRRATLAMLGLSLIDDDEIRAIKGARFVEADPETGELRSADPPAITSIDTPALDKMAEAKALGTAIIATFAIDAAEAKRIRGDLLCDRFSLSDHNAATAEQIKATREAVLSWEQPWADENRQWLRMIASAETATMARDVETVLGEQNVNDPFVLGALIDRLDALELEEKRTESRNRTIDAITTPS